jgi:adenylate kinase family enzyme
MKHVLITGSGGAGKSTLARALSEKIDVPVIHTFTSRKKAYKWLENIK